jgi:tRNA-splicing ligase RtcB (3'-phosphate/5'-hydroxy nucleic acid ligase)
MIENRVWGQHLIDCDPEKKETPFLQMNAAMSIEPCVGGALMPDAHLGYGLPVGGVVALDNAVCPYAVGHDIT